MPITKADLFDFLRLHRYAVQASHSPDGAPQAALVGFAANRNLQLIFDSFDSTRKVANLRHSPRVAFVIGGYATGDERTVQYEGVVDTPDGAELETLKRDYFAVHPDGLRRSRLAGITYFRVNPVWIRYTNFNVKPPQIVEFDSAALQSPDEHAGAVVPVRPYNALDEPWQPEVERGRVFNSFESPQKGTPGRG